MSAQTLLTFNAGSSTVKIGLFSLLDGAAVRLARALIDFRDDPLKFRVTDGPGKRETALNAKSGDDLREIVMETFDELARDFDVGSIVAVGHRVVHGGDRFAGPATLDAETTAAIEALTPLAPLHQPQALRLIHAVRDTGKKLLQVASFDTAFHRTNSQLVRRFALPRKFFDEGVRKYGFHGLSYKYVAGELGRLVPEVAGRKVVIAHLGSGASVCGIDGGQSRDTSMGFSTLDGIPMATRCGALDPGVLLYLLGSGGRTPAQLEEILYHRSGLLGVSGLSGDSRELLESDTPEAREAIELFVLRIAGEIARLAATLEGLDAIVFTAGIGENQPRVRAGVCDRLGWLGVKIDAAVNEVNARLISSSASRVSVFVIPTDEEQVIADEMVSLVGSGLA